MSKSQAVKIEISRAEGSIHECGIWHTVESWEAADALLNTWSHTASENGGSDKCDFKITFADDDTYNGTFYLKHWRCQLESDYSLSLSNHVEKHLRISSGEKPQWMDDERWKALNKIYAKQRQEAIRFLETKDIPA